MSSIEPRARTAGRPPVLLATLLTACLAAATAGAQDPVEQDPEPPKPDPVETARVAIDRWVRSDLDDRGVLDAAVEAILAAGKPGLELVAKEIDRTRQEDRKRLMAVDSLTTSTVIGFVQKATESGMIFAGQYDDLRVLQPAAGRFLLGLVVDTPDWFPDDMRPQIVPALRDVFPTGPSPEMLDRLTEICADEEFETEALRVQLGYALAQWGRRRFVQARLEELETNAGRGQTSDELYFVRELARLHYQLRDYPRAADRWQRFLAGTRALGTDPRALDLYDAACCAALAGRADAGLDAVEACLKAVAAGRTDSTQEITREMFETDPDLRLLRSLPRFQKAVKAAFGDGGESSDNDRDRAGRR